MGISADAWQEVDTNWQKVAAQVRHWQWLLDTGLPGDFGQIGEWLNQGEVSEEGTVEEDHGDGDVAWQCTVVVQLVK